MAVVTKTLRSAAGDYSSLVTWNATEATDLVSAGDTHVLECYAEVFYEASTVTISGWTTGASNYITITAAAGEGHGGVYGQGPILESDVSEAAAIRCTVQYTVFDGVTIRNTDTISPASTDAIHPAAHNILIDRCFLRVDSPIGSSTSALYVNAGENLTVQRSVVSAAGSQGKGIFINNYRDNTLTHCTIYGFEKHGIDVHNTNGGYIATNVAAMGSTTSDFETGGFTATRTDCASGDTSSGHVTGLSDSDFVDPSNNNFEINGTGSVLYDSGSSTALATDIAGNPFNTNDIGAYAHVVGDTTKTLRSSGGDYSSMVTWNATEATDLVTPNTRHVLDCYDDWPSGLAEAVVIEGWTTDATRYVTVRAADGQGHNGSLTSGFLLAPAINFQEAIEVKQEYTRLEGLRVRNDNNGGVGVQLFTGHGGSVVDSCIMSGGKNGTNTTAAGLRVFSTVDAGAGPALIVNCVGHDSRNGFYVNSATSGAIFRACTSVNNIQDGYVTAVNNVIGQLTWDNCVSFDNSGTDYLDVGSAVPTGQNNASEDGTAFGFGAITGVVSGDFEDYAGGDLTPSSGSKLENAGLHIPSVLDDIKGNPRENPPEIGAYEIFGSAPTPPTDVEAGGPYSGEVNTPTAVQGSFTAGSDPFPEVLWYIQAGPGGGTFSPATANTSFFTPDTVGTYFLRFIVNPTDGASSVLDNAIFESTATSTVQIDPDDLSQDQAVDNVTLTYTPPNFSIGVDDLTQNQTVDNVTLTYTPPAAVQIDPDDLTQNQTIDNVTLTYTAPDYRIDVDDLSQDQTIDNVTLTYTPPVYTIAVDDLTQNQFITSVRFGGLATGSMRGDVTCGPAMVGEVSVYNALHGRVTVYH